MKITQLLESMEENILGNDKKNDEILLTERNPEKEALPEPAQPQTETEEDRVNVQVFRANEGTESASKRLSKFLEQNHIVLDYEVIKNKGVVAVNDGFLLVASSAPAVKVTAKYEYS